MFAFPEVPTRFRYSTIRFFEREFGIEYSSFELRRKTEIHNAIINRSKEMSGYVVWVRRNKAFLIVPTLTNPEPYVFCEIPDWMEIDVPPNQAFITAKGTWEFRSKDGYHASRIFIVENYKTTGPDVDAIKPEISYRDCKEILFEGLQNVDEPAKDLIAHSFVSSPKTLDRLGGLTLSVYNESKRTSRTLFAHLKRFLPTELLHKRAYQLSIKEIGHSVRLEPFPWLYKSLSADSNLTREELILLNRPSDLTISDEVMISLQSEETKPKSLRDPAAVLADVPIISGNDLERSTGFYDGSPEILKFMIATHLQPISLPRSVYESGLDLLQEELIKFSFRYPPFRSELGKGGILDLGIHGKPTSLLHLALSDARSNTQTEMSRERIQEAIKIFEQNMDDTLSVWQKAFPGEGKHDLSSASPEQRRIYGYIHQHGPSSPAQVFDALNNELSFDSFTRWWKALYDQGGLYEKQPGVFDIAPHLRANR